MATRLVSLLQGHHISGVEGLKHATDPLDATGERVQSRRRPVEADEGGQISGGEPADLVLELIELFIDTDVASALVLDRSVAPVMMLARLAIDIFDHTSESSANHRQPANAVHRVESDVRVVAPARAGGHAVRRQAVRPVAG